MLRFFRSMQLFNKPNAGWVMVLVEVRVFSGLEKFLEAKRFGEPFTVEVKEGATLKDLLAKLKIPEDQVFTSLVHGQHRELHYVLCEGDRVSLFPPVGGG